MESTQRNAKEQGERSTNPIIRGSTGSDSHSLVTHAFASPLPPLAEERGAPHPFPLASSSLHEIWCKAWTASRVSDRQAWLSFLLSPSLVNQSINSSIARPQGGTIGPLFSSSSFSFPKHTNTQTVRVVRYAVE